MNLGPADFFEQVITCLETGEPNYFQLKPAVLEPVFRKQNY